MNPYMKFFFSSSLVNLVSVLVFATVAVGYTQDRVFTFDPPAEWLQETVSSPMRLAQFTLPRVEGDVEDAELVVF